MLQRLMTLPDGATLRPVPDLETPALTFYKIMVGEAVIGTFWVNTELVKIEPSTPPIVTPPVRVVVMYEYKIDKLNIRHEPTSNSDATS